MCVQPGMSDGTKPTGPAFMAEWMTRRRSSRDAGQPSSPATTDTAAEVHEFIRRQIQIKARWQKRDQTECSGW